MEITSIDDAMDSYVSFERAENAEPRFYQAIYSREEEDKKIRFSLGHEKDDDED